MRRTLGGRYKNESGQGEIHTEAAVAGDDDYVYCSLKCHLAGGPQGKPCQVEYLPAIFLPARERLESNLTSFMTFLFNFSLQEGKRTINTLAIC